MDTNRGTCPLCKGTGRKPANDSNREYGVKYGWWGYDKETDTFNCTNCGAQYMYGKPSGIVNLRKDNGQPCLHEYDEKTTGRCLTNTPVNIVVILMK